MGVARRREPVSPPEPDDPSVPARRALQHAGEGAHPITTSPSLGTAPSSRLRSLVLLGAAGALSLGAFGIAAPANAEVIPDAITSVTTSGEFKVGQSFHLSADWKVPDDSQPGDSFSLELPPELQPVQRTFDLRDADGEVVATAVAKDGHVEVTLTDYVLAHPKNVQGSLFFDIYVEQGTEAGQELVIRWGDESTTIVPEPGDYGTELPSQDSRKYAWSAGGNRNGWSIEVAGATRNGVITDHAQNQRILCDTVEVYRGTRQGSVLPSDFTLVDPQPDVQCENRGPGEADDSLVVPVGDIPADTVVRVTYASVPDPGQTEVGNSYTFASTDFQDEGSASDQVYNAGGDASGENGATPGPTPSPTPTPPTGTPTTSAPPSETTTPPTETATPPAETTTPAVVTTPPAPTTTSVSPSPVPASATPRLPRTGSEVLPLAAVAAGLVALGTGAVAVARRRR